MLPGLNELRYVKYFLYSCYLYYCISGCSKTFQAKQHRFSPLEQPHFKGPGPHLFEALAVEHTWQEWEHSVSSRQLFQSIKSQGAGAPAWVNKEEPGFNVGK